MSRLINISISASEQAKFKRWTEKLSRQTRNEVQVLVHKTLYDIHGRAVRFAPKDYGAAGLAGKMHIKVNSDKLGGSVGNIIEYAPFREWGTGDLVVVPSFVKTMFGVDSMQWKGETGRKVNSKAHPYLFESARMGVKEMTNKLNKMGFK